MNVLHLSAAAEGTGAGKAALSTHKTLLELGVSSRLLFLKSDCQSVEVYSYHRLSLFKKAKRFLYTSLDRFPLLFYPKKKSEIFSPGLVGHKLKKLDIFLWADVIHIHWANHGFVDLTEIKTWNKPVVWTLRDMWAFTGGCHQSFGCINYKHECGTCPSLASKKEKDLSQFVLKQKLKHIKDLDIHWVAISSWIQKIANTSTLLKGKSIEIIHSGVNSKMFNLLDKRGVRNKLKLPLDRYIILLGAGNIREKYKGFEYAKRVLQKMSPDIMVITFGNGYFNDGEIPQQTMHFGMITNIENLCEIYNAADVFLGPSIAEAMGKTFLEAQLCGLPAICFDETGPVDIITHKVTGYVAKLKDIDDLLIGLDYCSSTLFSRNTIRDRACKLFDIANVAEAYIRIYEKV